jgi:hypothetical protein
MSWCLVGSEMCIRDRLMSELKLAYPKYIDVALPANQACGRVAPAQAA